MIIDLQTHKQAYKQAYKQAHKQAHKNDNDKTLKLQYDRMQVLTQWKLTLPQN